MTRFGEDEHRTPAQLVVLEGYEEPIGYQRLVLYQENTEGKFVSTRSRFSALVIDDIESLGDVIRIVTPAPYHHSLVFESPAVVNKNDRRRDPSSIYAVLRKHIDRSSKTVTLALPHTNRHRGELELRQVRFKSHVSTVKKSLVFSRWMEAVNLQARSHNEHEKREAATRPRLAAF
ncbi:hypothetical protein [Solemya velesiana gill symbiont]|uniref:Uncharacterized protein n=1 Tax=Solemya velesiana gill symbiont TaxID=1918948 RepID=A0A1T2KXF5_9GAMM|nr:hypothetical protein [Solemya velesiana gill symbiont]OOZ37481.1 hypothetical protein BOW51_02180 [Solemya velesiana gill symbiont]